MGSILDALAAGYNPKNMPTATEKPNAISMADGEVYEDHPPYRASTDEP